MLPLVDRLGAAYDLVVPSLPGYGFSARPRQVGVDVAYVARLWHRLMRGLGYDRYGACGGDFGAGVAIAHGARRPGRDDRHPPEHAGACSPTPAPRRSRRRERAYVADRDSWASRERGYSAIQSTKPQTVGYGLNDSPAGLAAWLVEKWRSWGDTGGDVDGRFGRDELLTMLTLYWVTGSITSSMRDYFDNRWHSTDIGPDDRVTVPTAMAVFANEFVSEGEVPREYYERLFDIRRWTVFPRGGHFAAAEEPDLLAATSPRSSTISTDNERRTSQRACGGAWV